MQTMTIESFPIFHNIGLSLNSQNCYGIKPLQVNKNLGFNKLGLVTLSEALSVISLRAVAWIDSLPEVKLPELLIEESKQQQAVKVLNMQWTSGRKQLDLYLLQNQNAYLLGSLAILHPSGYPYTQYNLMEMLDTVNDKFLISSDFDLGIEIKDAGYGYLDGGDKITIFGSVERIITAYAPQTVTSINYGGDEDMIAQDFLVSMFQIAEGTTKPGYTGGVTYNYNQSSESIIGSFTIPVFASVDSVTGKINYLAKDAFNPPSNGGGSTPQNTAPTNITLSSTSIDENLAGGSTVGVFTASGGYGSNAFTYSLVSGNSDTDNAAFTITGNALIINASPDYETKSSYSIRVQVTDGNNLSYQKAFTVIVNDLVEDLPVLLLTVVNDELVNIGSLQDVIITNNGAIIDESGISFSNNSVVLTSDSGFDMANNFIFEFEVVNVDTSVFSTIVDFRDGSSHGTVTYISSSGTIQLRSFVNQKVIEMALPSASNLLCKYQRIDGENKFIINGVESTVWYEATDGMWTQKITLGKRIDGNFPMINGSKLKNIKLTIL